jgi:hypothetical protein
MFVETELQIIQKVQRTGIFKANSDYCGALHLEKILPTGKIYKHSAALPLFSLAVLQDRKCYFQ